MLSMASDTQLLDVVFLHPQERVAIDQRTDEDIGTNCFYVRHTTSDLQDGSRNSHGTDYVETKWARAIPPK